MLLQKLKHYLRLEPLFVLVAVASMGFLVLQLLTYDDSSILETIAKAQAALLPAKLLMGVGSGSFLENEASPWTKLILLPAGFKFDEETLRAHLKNTASADWPIVQSSEEEVISAPEMPGSRFIQHDHVPLFHSGQAEGEEKCDLELKLVMDELYVDERFTIPGNFPHILELFLEELDTYKDPYYQEVSPLFVKHLRLELKTDMVNHFWFRLLGSLVWLKDYGVHLVISRFLFSLERSRDSPKNSMILAQVFDKNWNELKDVRLVFPTNDLGDPDFPTFKVGDQDFYSYRFPRILPVPFYHDEGKSGGHYFGPEDPRVVVVRNQKGYDEPVIIFNAKHKKKMQKDDGLTEEREFRSIFTCFPFQLKKGKAHVTTNINTDTENQVFVRAVEMSISHRDKAGANKNWAPFVSDFLREEAGFDEEIYFATQLDNLEILKCDLVGGLGNCDVVYKDDGGVGPMRGGTPFINVNIMLREQTDMPLNKLIPPGREIYVAFARAHLDHCGCGTKFYRPNLIVLTRDTATYMVKGDNGEIIEAKKYFFKLSHVSSFLSLHVPIDPWYVDRPFGMCEGVNAIIPNGISNWRVGSLGIENGRWKADDKLTISFSVSDFNVDRVNLKGLLQSLLNVDDGTLFLPPPVADTNEQMIASFISQPLVDEEGNIVSGNIGFNGRNVKCAIEKCKEFCRKFGEDQASLDDEYKNKDNSDEKKEFEEKMKFFEETLREQEEAEKAKPEAEEEEF